MSNELNVSTCEPSVGSLPERLSKILEESARLLDSEQTPTDFHAHFLGRVAWAAESLGGAVWQRSTDGSFRLQNSLNWEALGLQAVPDAASCHDQVLLVAAQRERALWVPPHSGRKLVGDNQAANLTDHGLLFAPVLVERKVVGLVEIWLRPIEDTSHRRQLAQFLTGMAGLLAIYWHRAEWQSLLQQQQLWSGLEKFHQHIHRSLVPHEVAQWVAHEGRRLIECHQLSVAIQQGTTLTVAAVSGAAVLDSNSRAVRSLQALCEAVLAWGEKLTYRGKRDDSLPPAVLLTLDAYLDHSNSTTLLVLPLQHSIERETTKPFAALVAEMFEPGLAPEKLQERLELIGRHAAPALGNAIQVARMPLQRLSLVLALARDWTSKRKLARIGLYALPVAILLAVLVFVKAPLRMEAKGQLVPVQRQIVYAGVHGKIVEVKARHGDVVDKGQELLFLEDLDSQLSMDQLIIKITTSEQRLALLNEQIGKTTSNEERDALIQERINQEYELRKAAAERDILLLGSRSPRHTPVLAPLAGKVITFDAQEQLLGKTVKPGDPLVRVAAVKGAWEIELQIPERNLGPIREALRASSSGSVEVDLLLASQPHRTYKGRLYLDGMGGEATVTDAIVTAPARVAIDDDELAAQLDGLPVGLEVRAKVHCGSLPVGQTWFYDLWEFFFEHVVY